MKLSPAGLTRSVLAGLGVGAVAVVVYHKHLRPWHMRWGATQQERDRAWPGDELVPNAASDQTHAITIEAPAAAIWPWILQIGQDRAGFYSYTYLENLFGCEMRNSNRLVPEWQKRQVGDMVWMTPKEKFRGMGRMEIAILEPNRAMILMPPRDVPPSLSISGGARMTWGFLLDPINEHSTRLVMRARGEPAPRLRDRMVGYAFWEPAHFVMERRMMLSIKRLAETSSSAAGNSA